MKTAIILALMLLMPCTAFADTTCPPPVYFCDTQGNCQWVRMVEC